MTYSIERIPKPTENDLQLELLEQDMRFLAAIAESDKFESSETMRASNWDENFSTWSFIKSGEFWLPRGGLWMIYDNGIPLGLSGVYEYSPDIAVVGARSWISPAYRAKSLLGELVFPEQEKFCREKSYKGMMMTFNLNNQWLPNMILRASAGRALQMGKRNAEFYQGWEETEPRTIRGTFQRVLWKVLRPLPQ